MMQKKVCSIVSCVFLISFSVPLSAYEWTGNGSNRLWSNPDNWDTAGGPNSSWPWCDITPNGGGPLIDSSVTATFGPQMDLGWNGTAAVTVLDMTGGSLTGGNLSVGAYPYAPNYYGAVMNLSGGTVTLSLSLAVGSRTAGVLNMTGGSVTCAGGLQIAQGASTASGSVHLDGGTITGTYLLMCYNGAVAGTGHLDITGGKLVVSASELDRVNGYIAQGWVTGYGNSSRVVVTTVGSNIEITAVPEPAAMAGVDGIINPGEYDFIFDDALGTVTPGVNENVFGNKGQTTATLGGHADLKRWGFKIQDGYFCSFFELCNVTGKTLQDFDGVSSPEGTSSIYLGMFLDLDNNPLTGSGHGNFPGTTYDLDIEAGVDHGTLTTPGSLNYWYGGAGFDNEARAAVNTQKVAYQDWVLEYCVPVAEIGSVALEAVGVTAGNVGRIAPRVDSAMPSDLFGADWHADVDRAVLYNTVSGLAVSPASQTVDFTAGTTAFTVAGASSTVWTVTSDSEWLTAATGAGTGPGTITLNYTANSTTSDRTGTITLTALGSSMNLTVVQAKHPLAGDANRDNKVDVSDLGILAANYGTTGGASWTQGDFNGDNAVDVSDLGILAANYGTGTGSTLDFNKDAGALGLGIGKEESISMTSSPGCGSAGLSLMAGLLMMCGLLINRLRNA